MTRSEQIRNQLFGPFAPSEPATFEKVACPKCSSDASAYKTIFDNNGANWQITCFGCGQVIAETPDGKVVRQLRHKCQVRFRLG